MNEHPQIGEIWKWGNEQQTDSFSILVTNCKIERLYVQFGGLVIFSNTVEMKPGRMTWDSGSCSYLLSNKDRYGWRKVF